MDTGTSPKLRSVRGPSGCSPCSQDKYKDKDKDKDMDKDNDMDKDMDKDNGQASF